jgi:hypothetical protein
VGRKGVGEEFTVNDSYYADDAGLLKISREDLDQDLPEDDAHLREAGLEMHVGKWLADSVLPSKTEAMFFPKQHLCYEDYDPVSGISPTHDGVDLSGIVASDAAGTFVPFCSEFCYLGSMLNVDLTDVHDARHRVRKGYGCFFMLKVPAFRNSKISRAIKRVAYLGLVVMVCLHGCESWSVTAEIERILNSFQTVCLRVMLGVSKRKMRDERISTKATLAAMGLDSVLYCLRHLQLNYLGRVSRMPSSRMQRKLLSSWMDEPRLPNYPQTHSRSTLKAMASVVDAPEARWQNLARDETCWNKHVRQTDEDRDRQRRSLAELHCDSSPCHHARALARAAFPRLRAAATPFFPSPTPLSPASIATASPAPWLEGPLSAPVISNRGTPVSTRRRECVLGGGTLAPRQARGRAKRTKSIDAVDVRFFDPRNCTPPGAARPPVASILSTITQTRWTVKDVEATHSQFFVDVGHCPPEVKSVRLSQCGARWWRNRQQENRPAHRFSWMHPRDDFRKGRNPSS